MGPSGERCANCMSWDYTSGNFGFCRANAPMPSVCRGKAGDEYQLVWPSTGMDDWCGRFEKAYGEKTKDLASSKTSSPSTETFMSKGKH